jgi:hypothetical protein
MIWNMPPDCHPGDMNPPETSGYAAMISAALDWPASSR